VGFWDRWVWSRVQNREALTLEQLLAEETTPTYAGVAVGTDQALRLSAVWSCVRLLADAVSTLPLDVYRRGERDPLPELPPLLRTPAAGMSLNEWLYAVMVSLLLRGNAYGIITARSGATLLPSQVDLAHPDRLAITVLPDGRVQHRLNGKEIPAADVWHVRAYTFPGTVLGLSPVEYARQTIGLGLAAERFGAKFFGDGATPTGILYADRDPGPKAVKDLKAEWMAAHSNRRDAGPYAAEQPGGRAPAVLAGVKFEPISVNAEESQFLGTLDANVNAIARLYGVPPEMIGGTTAGPLAYTSPEMRSLDLLTYTIRGWLVRLENAISALLPSNQYARFNAGGLVRVDLKSRYEAHEIALRAGFLTVNEVRELEDRGPLPDAGGSAVA
jgi:HK97 family phage portal protein